MKDLEDIGRGDTNKLEITEEGTLLKEFSRLSVPAAVMGVGMTLLGKPRLYLRNERIENELAFKDLVRKHGLEAPEIYDRDGPILEMEYVEGRNLENEIYDDPRRWGEFLGKKIKALEEDGIYLVDAGVENFKVWNDEVYSLDHEFSEEDLGWQGRMMDRVSLLVSVLHLDSYVYIEFREGFEETYGRIGPIETFMASTIAFPYTLLFKHDINKALNVIRNSFWTH